ncbi:unnamed protein product [Caenorhabditis bovis]|uniref:Uncharacterized protein n=1 Tax=Caenorhabditis bovis TaxID=2654633 RepID=A0A8S1EZQ3_9PELO|nr:unnamed protein product [Caenorhabditis bovis]
MTRSTNRKVQWADETIDEASTSSESSTSTPTSTKKSIYRNSGRPQLVQIRSYNEHADLLEYEPRHPKNLQLQQKLRNKFDRHLSTVTEDDEGSTSDGSQ